MYLEKQPKSMKIFRHWQVRYKSVTSSLLIGEQQINVTHTLHYVKQLTTGRTLSRLCLLTFFSRFLFTPIKTVETVPHTPPEYQEAHRPRFRRLSMPRRPPQKTKLSLRHQEQQRHIYIFSAPACSAPPREVCFSILLISASRKDSALGSNGQSGI